MKEKKIKNDWWINLRTKKICIEKLRKIKSDWEEIQKRNQLYNPIARV